MSTHLVSRSFVAAVLFLAVCFWGMPVSAKLVLHFDMEEVNSPLVDAASGYTAEEVDDGHLYSLPGPEGFGLAAGLEDNGAWRLDEEESKIFREFANDFSVATWIYLDSDTLDFKASLGEVNSTLNRFFGDDIAWDADGWGMGVFEDGRIRFTKNGVIDLDTADAWVDPDEWVHIAATVSSADGVTVYVDGEDAEVFADTRDLNNGVGNNGEDDVYGVGRTYDIGEGQWVGGRFDEIRVYDHVLTPEEVAALLVPGDSVPGDYNGDGVLNSTDIDLQAVEMKKPEAEQDLATFDHNNDGVINVGVPDAPGDRLIWVKDLRKTSVGDSNLDDVFDSGDLVGVFTEGKYDTGEMATWAQGDWSGDMVFDSSDLVLAFQDGGYVTGAVAAVPEPATLLLLVVGVIGIGLRRRRE